MIDGVLYSFTELWREWCMSRMEAADGLLLSPIGRVVSCVMGEMGDVIGEVVDSVRGICC